MNKKKYMDCRCPLGLSNFPTQICPLAIQRLKEIERIDGNISHVQESKMQGCEWYINDKESNYCFFKYMYDNEGREHSTIEMSEKLKITQAAIYSGLNRATSKVKELEVLDIIKKDEHFEV